MVFRTQGTGGSDYSTSIGSEPGIWRNIVATHDGYNINMYSNTVNVLSSVNSISNQNTSNPISIGAYASGIYASYGAIPIYRAYNRALSVNEIQQNYNSQKSRFGL
jgi:hypothetical protein